MTFITNKDIINLIRGHILQEYRIQRLHNHNTVLTLKFENGILKVELKEVSQELEDTIMAAAGL